MALTATEKQKAREYLGIPAISAGWAQETPNRTLEQQLDALASNAEAEASFKAIIAKIDTSRADLETARGRLKAAEVGDVKLNANEIRQRWQEDLELCEQLGAIISMPVYRHKALRGARCVEVC